MIDAKSQTRLDEWNHAFCVREGALTDEERDWMNAEYAAEMAYERYLEDRGSEDIFREDRYRSLGY